VCKKTKKKVNNPSRNRIVHFSNLKYMIDALNLTEKITLEPGVERSALRIRFSLVCAVMCRQYPGIPTLCNTNSQNNNLKKAINYVKANEVIKISNKNTTNVVHLHFKKIK
jgi:hypothetical protein